MKVFVKNSAIVLSLAVAALASVATASAGHPVSADRHGPAVSVASGDITLGYRDGYWDKTRHWHRWDNHRNARNYRNDHVGNYRNRDHATATVVELGSGGRRPLHAGGVVYAYRDGFWDRTHRWHRWNDDRDYQDYRNLNADNYRDWKHDRDGGDGWRRD